MAKLSIIMPYRDAATTISAAVRSVLQQTFTNFELIAVNDNSRDNSASIVNSMADKRFKQYNNPGDGLVDALNFALGKVSTDWIARMDADDIMHPVKLEQQWQELLKHPETDVISCQARLFPKDRITDGFREYMSWQNSVLTHEQFMHQCYVEMPLTNPTAVFRKSMFDHLGEYLKGDVPEDYEFWLRALREGYRFKKIPQVLYDWRDSSSRYTRTATACSRPAFDQVRVNYLCRDVRLQHNRPLVFCGAGRNTRKRAARLIEKGFTPSVWVDIDPKKIGNQINGIPVRHPEWILDNQHHRPFVLIYIASHGAREQLSYWLESNGLVPGEDFLAVG